MTRPRYPALYQVNTRVWLTALARRLGRTVTLDDVPDAELDRWAHKGFDWIWLLSVWQTGPAAQRISRENAEWRREFEHTLPDLSDDDIGGSGFAVADYRVHRHLGGDEALARLRQRLRARGLRLMLDFVPNHVAPDHPWVESHPDFFVGGTEDELTRAPGNYVRLSCGGGERIVAHGRDPYFPGWPDTLQLNYGNPALQQAMIGELSRIAGQCDGLRCDMAMLVLPEVFQRTWGIRCEPFWPIAIATLRTQAPEFCMMAEVYWDLEWTLQQQGFDYTYDKRLYDRLRGRAPRPIREHFLAGLDFQDKLARFLENHDEPRAAATFPPEVHRAAAVTTFLAPGLRFFHQGQLEGCRVRVSPHLVRGPLEPVDEAVRAFYDRLLEALKRPVVREGHWRPLECLAAWEGNWTNDCFLAFAWELHEARLIVAVNYSDHASQCHVRLPFDGLHGATWRLDDRLSDRSYQWRGEDLAARGLYVDCAAWQSHVFELHRIESQC